MANLPSQLSSRLFGAVFLLWVFLAGFSASGNSDPASGSSLPLNEADRKCQAALESHQCPPETLPLCEQAATAAIQTLGRNNLRTAKLFGNLGECHLHGSQFKHAEAAIRQSLEIRISILGKEHPSIAESLNNLSVSLGEQGRVSEAEELQREAIALLEKQPEAQPLQLAQMVDGLASFLSSQAKYEAAEELHQRALTMKLRLLPKAHSSVAISQNNLALVLYERGKFRSAEKLFREVLAVRQKILGKDHPDVAQSLNNLAFSVEKQGNLDEAVMLHREALAIYRKVLASDHPAVTGTIGGLASLLITQGNYNDAEELLRQALLLIRQRPGNTPRNEASCLNNLALVLRHQGKYVESEALNRQALTLREKLLGKQHPDVAVSQTNLAVTLSAQGKHGEAELLHRQALEIRQRYLGSDHPDVAQSFYNLAGVLMNQSQLESAVSAYQTAIEIQERSLQATSSEVRTRDLLAQHRYQEDAVYSLTLRSHRSEIDRLALRLALLRKGRVAEVGAVANRLLHRSLGQQALKNRFEEWISLRRRRETLLYGGLGSLSPIEYQKRLQNLRLQAESLEDGLAAELPELRSARPPAYSEILSQVAEKLPPSGVLVEVVWTRLFQGWGSLDRPSWGSPHYVAMLLFPDQRVVTVDLGEEEQINAQVLSLQRVLSSPQSAPQSAAQALHATVFAKLENHLAGRKDVYLALDGSLHLVPFDALHDGKDYLQGRYRFHYLTSGRDLLRTPSSQNTGSALVLGNPVLGPTPTSPPQAAPTFYQQLAGFGELVGAQREAEAVAKLLGTLALTGVNAKEEVLWGRLAPWVLHLATHGVFLSNLEEWQLPGTRTALLELPPFHPRPEPSTSPLLRLPGEFGPMNRSALLLSGVRQGANVEDKSRDGLLTAEEARSMNLDGTQLVVLSACDTGRGEAIAGQGIYGLRRAFLVAGAETVVTSLWRVQDEATGELMRLYYQKLLDPKRPRDRLDAMIESMQELRARPERSHPYYWASFLPSGADGPLRKR